MDTDIFFADTVRYEYYPNIQNHLKIKLLVPYLETGFWKTIKKGDVDLIATCSNGWRAKDLTFRNIFS